MILKGTYADFDKFAVLSDSFSHEAFPSSDARIKFYQAYKDLSIFMEEHPLTQEFNDLNKLVQEFNATNTQDNQADPERISQQKLLNEQIKSLNAKKILTPVEFPNFTKFAWKSFISAYEKEAGKVFQSAKALSTIDEWIESIETLRKQKDTSIQ